MLFTTSWDDGYALDLKLGELLSKYGCTGTFYICPAEQHSQKLLTAGDIRKLSESHEIGAHSLTHPHLPRMSMTDAKHEIEGSKTWVEEMTEKPCTSFCYPYGDFNPAVTSLVRAAGFICARTTKGLHFHSNHPFALPVTLQAYPFPKRPVHSRWWHMLDPFGPLRVKYGRLRTVGIPLSKMGSWLSLATALFDRALKTEQPFFHLWGHSHEIEKYDQWNDLEKFLSHVQHAGVRSVTNTDLVGSPM